MVINETKRESYVKRLFLGEKKRVDSGERKKKERISPDDAQGKEIVRKYKAKCDVCSLPYTDPHQFAIHHINGDPEITITRNLTLLCSNCHNGIHGTVDSQIKDYKNNQKKIAGEKQSLSIKPKKTKVKCGFCRGSGKGLTGFYHCPVCQGEGQIEVFSPPEKCRVCKGTGKDSLGITTCQKCGGTGYTNTTKRLD
ncbi:hypothetical protein DSECCO2_45550 [anaerobic digester metagenome]